MFRRRVRTPREDTPPSPSEATSPFAYLFRSASLARHSHGGTGSRSAITGWDAARMAVAWSRLRLSAGIF